MATLQDQFLAQQIVQALARLAPNMQDNAATYKANAANKDAATLAAEINGDMDQFLKWITKFEVVVSGNLSALTSALTAISVSNASANADKNAMKNAAIAMKAASKTTQAEINTAADALIAAVPNYVRIF